MRKVLFIPLFITVIVAQAVDYDTEIQPLWNGNCTSCHTYGHSSGLDLTSGQSYNNLVEPTYFIIFVVKLKTFKINYI